MASPKRNANRRKFNREPIDVDDLTSTSSFSGIRDVIESHFGKSDNQDAAAEAGGADAARTIETDPSRPQFVWEPKGVPFSVRLSAELIERLEKESLDIFRAITNRGSEVGGILLGHVLPGWPVSIVVEDYEPVTCAYTLGPTYRLTEEEQERVEEAVEKRKAEGGLVTVGFFRSNTRATLALQEEDLDLFDEIFPEDHNVFLLVKPFSRKPCQGAVFVRQGGKVQSESSHLEFPFSRAELEKTGALQPGLKVSDKPGRVGPVSTSDRVTSISGAAVPAEARRQEPAAPVISRPEPEPAPPPRVESAPAPPVLRIERPAAGESGLRAPAEPRIEPRVERKVEARIEPKVEPRVEPKAETRVEQKIEPPVEPKVEPRVEPKVETRKPWEKPATPLPPLRISGRPAQGAETRQPAAERPVFSPASRVEPKAEPQGPPKFMTRIQARVQPSVQPRIETNLGSKAAPTPEPAQAPGFTAKVEPRVQAAPQPSVEAKVTPEVTRVAPKAEPAAPPRPTVPIQPTPQAPSQIRTEAKAEPETAPRVRPKPATSGPRFTKIRPRFEAPAAKAETRAQQKSEPKPEPKVETTAAPAFGYPEEAESEGKRRWILPLVIALVIGGVGSWVVLRPGSQSPAEEQTSKAAGAPAHPQAASLTLRTEGSASGLTVFWDGNAPPISTAPGGRLSIRDGAAAKNVLLSSDELKKGIYEYKPRTDDVTFRLELTDLPRGQGAFGTTRVLGAKRMGRSGR
jgi:hypothetical protein